MSGLFGFRGTCHIKIVKLVIQTSHNTFLGHMHILARTLTCDASICGPTRLSSMHSPLWPTSGVVNKFHHQWGFFWVVHMLRQEHIVCGEEGGRGPSYVVRSIWTSLCVGAWFTVLRHVAHQSCAFRVFNIYMFGPHAKRWWLSSCTHLSGYQRYRCFPSMGPLGPSLLFAWQRERLIILTYRRGLFFCLSHDIGHDVRLHI